MYWNQICQRALHDLAVWSAEHQEEPGDCLLQSLCLLYTIYLAACSRKNLLWIFALCVFKIRKKQWCWLMWGWVVFQFRVVVCWCRCRKENLQICDLSTFIIEGHTSVTQITGTGFEREREQQRASFALHVVKSVLASLDCASKETGWTWSTKALSAPPGTPAWSCFVFVTQDADRNSAHGIMSNLWSTLTACAFCSFPEFLFVIGRSIVCLTLCCSVVCCFTLHCSVTVFLVPHWSLLSHLMLSTKILCLYTDGLFM